MVTRATVLPANMFSAVKAAIMQSLLLLLCCCIICEVYVMENLTVDAFHFCRYSCLHIQAGLFTTDHDRVMHLELLHYAVPHA